MARLTTKLTWTTWPTAVIFFAVLPPPLGCAWCFWDYVGYDQGSHNFTDKTFHTFSGLSRTVKTFSGTFSEPANVKIERQTLATCCTYYIHRVLQCTKFISKNWQETVQLHLFTHGAPTATYTWQWREFVSSLYFRKCCASAARLFWTPGKFINYTRFSSSRTFQDLKL